MIIPDYIDIDYQELKNGGIYIRTIEIDPAHRGKGLFKEYLNKLLEEYKFISLEAWITLVPMYSHLGFEDLGEDYEGYHEMIKMRS